MRALLVQAKSPPTYWSYEYSLPFTDYAAALPPLGLATLAALLPRHWELRIRDLHLGPLEEADLAWADAVLVSGMLAQAESIRDVLRKARRMRKRTVVGGPAATTSPEAFPEADHVFLGEAEGRIATLVSALEVPGTAAPRVLSPPDALRPDLRTSPVPRFDLLDLRSYASLSVQASRGCPFQCEFCDIIEVFGRVPRLKSPDQLLAELEELWRLGARGSLFFVDDNFIGNRREVAKLLPRLAAWQDAHGRPFDIYTEASLDLANEPALVEAMVAAGFSAVFVGIETPSAEALESAGKKQNLRVDPAEAVRRLTAGGLEVFAGFILGFDTDGADIFDRHIELVSSLPMPRAMVGLLLAVPGTALWRRLEREGRLRDEVNGDQFSRPNFVTALPERTLLTGYRRVLATLYSADGFYARCHRYLEEVRFPQSGLRRGWHKALVRAVWRIGIVGPRRAHFWKLVARALRRGVPGLSHAVLLAILGEHLVCYTEEVVLPRLDGALATITVESPAPAQACLEPQIARTG